MNRRMWFLMGMALATALLLNVTLRPAQTLAAGYDRPAKDPHQSRSVVIASHGIVATNQPLAAQVGWDILKRRGLFTRLSGSAARSDV